MTEPIRVLHFADVHVGMENYGKTDPDTGLSSRVVDFLRRMDDMVEYAHERDVDLVIFAGDAFKTRTPNPTFQREFAWRIRDLAELAPVVLLVGNHDLPPSVMKASSIEIYDVLGVHNVMVAQEYETKVIETKRGNVVVGAAPYPIRSRLMQRLEDTNLTIKESDNKLEEVLTEILTELAVQADELAEDETTPRLLTGHFTVHGAITGSERNVMLGRDVRIPLSLLADNRWDYVALGHIHKHQDLTHDRDEAPPVVYSGSIERIDFGEEGEPKGFCWVELERNATKWEYVPVDARPMVTLRADCRKDATPNNTILKLIRKHNLQDAIVRIIVQLTPETDSVLNDSDIREGLKQAGVFHIAGIQRKVESADRTRLQHNPEEMSHEDLLRQYFISKEYDEDAIYDLMLAAKPIINPEQEGD